MILRIANSSEDIRSFFRICDTIYIGNPFYRATDNDIIRLLIKGPTHFHTHADVKPYLIYYNGKLAGRFAMIHDLRQYEYVQIAFFEALPGLQNVSDTLKKEAKLQFPDCTKLTVGLNGHLNYGAGILQNNFDQVPVFGIPYTASHYPGYFSDLEMRRIITFRFPAKISHSYMKKIKEVKIKSGISIRKLNRRKMSDDTLTYTDLNNLCFTDHPFWSDRDGIEDLELFEPFSYLLKDENLIFAEFEGKPVGFLLWFPDFNQLVKTQRELKASSKYARDVIRYKLFNPIDTFRFTEIAVDPEFRKKGVEMTLINQMVADVTKAGYKWGEGGFIFEENLDSVNMAVRYIERIIEEEVKTHSEYAVYETKI